MRKTILYIGWVGYGNHGDDVCQEIFADYVHKLAQEHAIELDIKALFPQNFSEYTLARIDPDLVVLGAGSLFEPVYLKPLILAQQYDIPTAVWGSGYDSFAAPSEYFNISPDSAFMLRQAVSRAKLVGVRGSYTKAMLEQIGAVNPTLDVSGDPGLLLNKTPQTMPELKPITQPIIGVNWGTALNRVYGGNEFETAQALAQVLRKLAEDYTIVIYPVWGKDLQSCQELSTLIGSSKWVITLDRVPTIAELIDLYQQADFTINMKLHANVFTAAVNRPFISLAYRLKCFDFADSVGLSELALGFDEPNFEAELTQRINKLINNRMHYLQVLDKHVKEYKRKLTDLTSQMIELIA